MKIFFVTQLMRFVLFLLFGGSFVAQSYLVSFDIFWNKLSLGGRCGMENLGCGNLAQKGGFFRNSIDYFEGFFRTKVCSLKHRKWLLERVWSCTTITVQLSELYNLNVLFTSVQCIFHYYLFDFGDTFFSSTVNYTKLKKIVVIKNKCLFFPFSIFPRLKYVNDTKHFNKYIIMYIFCLIYYSLSENNAYKYNNVSISALSVCLHQIFFSFL